MGGGDVFSLPHYSFDGDQLWLLLYLLRSRSVGVLLISHAAFAYCALPFMRKHAPWVTVIDYVHVLHVRGSPMMACGGFDHMLGVAGASVAMRAYLDATLCDF